MEYIAMPWLNRFKHQNSLVLQLSAFSLAIFAAYFFCYRFGRETDYWLLPVIIVVSLTVPLSRSQRQQAHSFRRQVLKALRDHEMKVLYQPIVRLVDEKIIGAEALLRWPGSALSTECLIAKAEQYLLIHRITEYVLRRAIQDWRSFQELDPDFCMNINISAPELMSDSFIEQLSIIAIGLPVGAIALEITERQSAPLDKVSVAISRLQKAGYKVYLDDFGTGYSSITALLDLPIDGIKFDRAFIESPNGLCAIKAIHALSGDLGRNVVVEGVETLTHKNSLLQIDQEMIVQGWLFGTAMQGGELLAKMKSSR